MPCAPIWSLAIRAAPSEGAPVRVEPMTGIEPAYSAWEADVLPLNYIGVRALGSRPKA